MRLIEFYNALNEDTGSVYYHGTKTTSAAKSILRNGIQPPDLKGQRGHLTPMEQRVYLTQNLSYAIIYALGGDYLGHKAHPSSLKGAPYGFVFVVPDSELRGHLLPDEDEVGEAIHTAMDVLRQGTEKALQFINYATNPSFIRNVAEDVEFCRQLVFAARSYLTPTQFKKIPSGEYTYYASGGKRFIKTAPKWFLEKLIEKGSHVSHQGAVQPSECWKIAKKKSHLLQRDGSNFFDIAERVA